MVVGRGTGRYFCPCLLGMEWDGGMGAVSHMHGVKPAIVRAIAEYSTTAAGHSHRNEGAEGFLFLYVQAVLSSVLMHTQLHTHSTSPHSPLS